MSLETVLLRRHRFESGFIGPDCTKCGCKPDAKVQKLVLVVTCRYDSVSGLRSDPKGCNTWYLSIRVQAMQSSVHIYRPSSTIETR